MENPQGSCLQKLQSPIVVLTRRWISTFVPHVLSRVNRVAYGLVPYEVNSPRNSLAIPFLAKDVPALQSEFAHPDVVIGLTYLAFRHDGLRPGDVREVVDTLQRDFCRESGPAEERNAFMTFETFFEGGSTKAANVPPLDLIDTGREEALASVHAKMGRSTLAVEYFLDKIAFSRALRYPP